MIKLYSGTPGSGKSLDTAKDIYLWSRAKKPVICNFQVNLSCLPEGARGRVRYVPNEELTPDLLVAYSRDFFDGTSCREGGILLIIDEAQLLFNSRDWGKKGRDRWNWFFCMHRHFGYDIILCAQFDRMLDRQIRSLIEYEYVHRKVSNFGFKGLVVSALMLSPTNLFVRVKFWYPLHEKLGSEFYRCRKKYRDLYDTFSLLDAKPGNAGGG